MAWSDAAASAAARWAVLCTWGHDPDRVEMGQNLYASSSERSAAEVVASWVGEAADYDYSENRCATGETCGHYTQVVWRSSVGLGCAVARCTTGSPFGTRFDGVWWNVVCNYSPPGNWRGERPY